MARPRAGRFPVILGATILLLALVPYVVGCLAEPPRQEFLGFIENPADSNPYVSWIRQAADGKVFLESLYSPEAAPPHLFNLMTFILGALARAPGVSPIVAYHVGRVVLGALLLLALWWVAGVFGAEPRARRLAFAWMSVGSGVGWVYVLIHGSAYLDPPRTLDLRIPEGYTFYSLLTFPHLAASQALLVLSLGSYFRAAAAKIRSRSHAIVAGAAALALGAFHPYPLLTVGAVVVLYSIYLAATRRVARPLVLSRPLTSGPPVAARPIASYAFLWSGLLVLGAVAAGLAWNLFMFSRDPVLASWRAQNVTPSLHPLQVLLGYGLALWLLPWAIYVCWKGRRPRAAPASQYTAVEAGAGDTCAGSPARDSLAFLCLWILAAGVLIYAPLPFQRRLIEGVQVPITLVTSIAIAGWLSGRVAVGRSARIAGSVAIMTALVLVSAPSSGFLVGRSIERVRSGGPEWFASRDELDAMEWLAGHAAPGSVVLASVETANRVPRFAQCRVFAGHFCQTRDFARRAAILQAFFRASGTSREVASFLSEERIDWLFYGPAERRLGGARGLDPAASPFLEEAYCSGEVRLYRVRR